jgi:hypothetical protein
MALISFVRPRRRHSSRRRCCLSNPAPIHIVVQGSISVKSGKADHIRVI